MKNYKRLTERSEVGALYITGIDGKKCSLLQADAFDRDYCLAKFEELEDKIESGKLCDREEVRKETAREILKPLYDVIMEYPDCCVNLSEDIKFLMEKYGIELDGLK